MGVLRAMREIVAIDLAREANTVSSGYRLQLLLIFSRIMVYLVITGGGLKFQIIDWALKSKYTEIHTNMVEAPCF